MSAETALVTGASSGIGLELARLLARDGSDLVLVARRADRLEELASELRPAGIAVTVIAADLAETAASQRLAARLAADDLTIDVLINNAGFGAHGRFAELSRARQLGMLQLNAVALTELTHRLLPPMLARGRGAVLNVASTAAFQPGPFMAVYYASKAYVLSLSEALAEETRGSGVTVTCLAPGPTRTEFAAAADMEDAPLFRLGAMDVARVARYGYSAMRRGQVVAVPGLGNRAGVAAVRALPRFAARRLVRLANGS